MNIPLAHIQGGEVTGNIDEKVRHAITKLADVHLVASEKAAERVIKMGEEKDAVFVTGCPSIDLAKEVLEYPELDFNPYEKYGGVGKAMDVDKGYLVVLQHPVTTEYQMAKIHVEETLKAVRDSKLPTLWFWPNVDAGADGTSKGIRAFREWDDASNIHFFKNMTPSDFLKLINNCKVLVGNSSVAIREASFLGVPAVNIGSRQLGRDRGKNVTDVGYSKEAILQAIQDHVKNGKAPRDEVYGDGTAGAQIADVLSKVPLRFDKKLTY
jgi:UDP-hydrolysing UDP-N-acetyl-D-glucosamine 2-epimerase